MGEQKEKMYINWFYSEAGMSAAQIFRLISRYGSAEEIYRRYISGKLTADSGQHDGKTAEQTVMGKQSPERAYEAMNIKGLNICWTGCRDYPRKLTLIAGPPKILYYRGEIPDADRKSIAVVGARSCSQYGRTIAEEFGRQFAAAGIAVISGMARGIDSICQYSALSNGGCSVGVLGCGADICYPPENRELYEMLIRDGAVISEYPVSAPPLGRYFPARNRIISGLSDAVVVVEAREKSGTMITVDFALEQGKDVYAVPGRITDCLSGGCNRLIRQGADLVLTAQELIDELGMGSSEQIKGGKKEKIYGEMPHGLDEAEQLIWNALDCTPMSAEEIRQRVSDRLIVTLPQLMQILLQMCFKGAARQISGAYYSRV